jgi:uncharacterized integral membrane protein
MGMSGGGESQDDAKHARARGRLMWFGMHILVFVAVMIVLVAVSILMNVLEPWFVFPLVAWGAPLAVHAAFAMGLFDSLLRRD